MLMTVLFYGSASESSLSRHFNRIKPPFCLNVVVLSGRYQHKKGFSLNLWKVNLWDP